jgi:hypothetical protein
MSHRGTQRCPFGVIDTRLSLEASVVVSVRRIADLRQRNPAPREAAPRYFALVFPKAK